MKYLWLLLLVGCTKADAKLPPPPSLTIQAVGDTARGFVSWSAVRGATNYRYWVTVANTNGTWTNLPFAVSTTQTTASFKAARTNADSAYFIACVRSYAGNDSSAGGCTAPRYWKRPLGVPVVVWDSLKVASAQHTSSVCRLWLVPQASQMAVSMGNEPCPLAAWFPGYDVFVARDAMDTVRVCYVDSTMGFGWPWPEPPQDGTRCGRTAADTTYRCIVTHAAKVGCYWHWLG